MNITSKDSKINMNDGIVKKQKTVTNKAKPITKKEATIKLKQIRSSIGCSRSQIQTLKGLGLNKIGRVSLLSDTPEIRGMVNKVDHMLDIL